MIRFGYRTRLLEIAQDYDLGNNFRETVLLAPVPKHLEEMNLRMHYRASIPMGVQAYIAQTGKNMREVVDENLERLRGIMRHDLLEKEKPQEEMIHEWTQEIYALFENISLYKKPQIANLLDLSQGGALLSHPSSWHFQFGDRLDLTLSWEDYRIELASRVIRHGELGGRRATELNVHGRSVRQPDAPDHAPIAGMPCRDRPETIGETIRFVGRVEKGKPERRHLLISTRNHRSALR